MNNIAEFLMYLQQLVKAKRENAGYTGRMNSACTLETQIRVYRAGSSNRIPDVWKEYYKQFINENNPDYAQYLLLKEKFEK